MFIKAHNLLDRTDLMIKLFYGRERQLRNQGEVRCQYRVVKKLVIGERVFIMLASQTTGKMWRGWGWRTDEDSFLAQRDELVRIMLR